MSAERKYKADPGIGRDDAPIGSEQWAQAVRLHLQTAVKDLDWEPQRVKRYYALVAKHRAWTLMNKPDGSYFANWEEFCAHPQPWGLGKPWEEIRPFIEAASGKKAVQLETVAPAKSPPGKPVEEKDAKRPFVGATQDKVLRAIAERAPEPVRELFKADLIGAKEAAALGPKNPTPEEAAKVTAIAIEAKGVAAEAKPKTPPEKRATQRKVNALVRDRLDREPDPVTVAARAVAKVPFHRLAEFVAAMPEQTRKALRMVLVDTGSS